jgi:hypothetical protein
MTGCEVLRWKMGEIAAVEKRAGGPSAYNSGLREIRQANVASGLTSSPKR